VPEECLGQWSKVWQQGNVDMCFWPNYTPNQESLKRFTRQFLWEQSVHPHGIPNWAWGHAVKIGIITEEKVPPNIPKDYDWPKLQQAWYEGKKAGNTNAKLGGVSQAASSSDLPIATDPQATLLTHQKLKDKDDGHQEESPKSKSETRQDIVPKETPQDQEPKHKEDGHKKESPKGKYDGHKEEEPKDKDDGHKEEDPKPERALFWLLKGEDPKPTTARHWLFEGALKMQKEPENPKGEGISEQKEPKGKQQKQKTNKMK